MIWYTNCLDQYSFFLSLNRNREEMNLPPITTIRENKVKREREREREA